MKRYLLSSPKLNVSAEIWYNDRGLLARVDLVNCIMNRQQLDYLAAKIDMTEAGFNEGVKGSLFKVTPLDVTITVDDFLHIYPYARNSHLVKEWWPKQPAGLHLRVYFAAIDYREYCQRNHRYKPKIAMQWLKDKEYLNDWKTL